MITGIFQMLSVLLMESISPSKKLADGGLLYYNYKHTHSVILLVVAGPNYECLYADVGVNGRSSNGRIWGNSSTSKLLDDDKFLVPKPEKIPCNDKGVLLG